MQDGAEMTYEHPSSGDHIDELWGIVPSARYSFPSDDYPIETGCHPLFLAVLIIYLAYIYLLMPQR
jgi:hypothetical protein